MPTARALALALWPRPKWGVCVCVALSFVTARVASGLEGGLTWTRRALTLSATRLRFFWTLALQGEKFLVSTLTFIFFYFFLRPF